MKSLIRLVVVVVLLLAVAAFFLRDSPYWTPLEIQRGLEERNVDRVERVVALERFSASSTAALASLFADELGVAGGDLGSQLLGALVGAVGQRVGDAVARESAQEMRRAIREGRLERSIGPFRINEGFDAIGGVTTSIDGGTLELKGKCGDADASLVLLLERHDDGPFGGRPRRYMVVGIDQESGRNLAKQCRSSSSPSSSKTPRR
ncbi:MAG: hypothetical protein Q8O67_15770 [Deltaproteobacteria bacterium]|nr:hypothetical protein [Deltaproteobacteria bacterium]